MKKPTTKLPAATKEAPEPKFSTKDQGEDIAIIETKTGRTMALVPYKPKTGAAHREIFRDRLTLQQAKRTAAIIIEALSNPNHAPKIS